MVPGQIYIRTTSLTKESTLIWVKLFIYLLFYAKVRAESHSDQHRLASPGIEMCGWGDQLSSVHTVRRQKKNEESHYLKNQRSYPRSGKLLRRSCSWNLTDGSVLSKIKIKEQLVISLDKLLQSVYWHVSRYLCQRGCLPLIRVGMEPLWCILVQIGISVYESCIESIIN